MIVRPAIILLAATIAVSAQTPPPVAPLEGLVRPTTAASRMLALAADPAPIATVQPRVKVTPGPPIGQGNEGSCVGHALVHALNCDVPAPRYRLDHADARALWMWARDHDSLKSNDGDPAAGTFVYDGLRRLKQLGYVAKPPLWGLAYERELRPHILRNGPVVFTSLWLASMDRPNPATGEVSVDPKAAVRGGHAYLCFAFRPAETIAGVKYPARYYFQQSWTGFAPFDALPDGPQIFWVAVAKVRWLMVYGGAAWPLEKIRPKVDGGVEGRATRVERPANDSRLP